MSAITIFLGRLLGLYLVAISGGMLANRRRTLATLDEMARSGPWMLLSAMVATAGGLAVMLGHQVWGGGALPVLVTLVGWAALLKGVTLLPVPSERIAAAYKAIGFERFFHVWMGRRAGCRALGDGNGVRRLITRPKHRSGSGWWDDRQTVAGRLLGRNG
jgi:hypothetical protein